MKKLFLCVLAVLILLSGCENAPELNIHVDQATSYAVNYLNNVVGYDSNSKYELKYFLKSEKESYPQLYRLFANGNEILAFIIKPEEDIGPISGVLYYEENGQKMMAYPAFETDTALFTVEGEKVNLNDYLYLEYVTDISIEGEFIETDESCYEALKSFAINELPFAFANKGDEITVYEHLNIIRIEYSKEKKGIIRDNSGFLYFPIAVNGVISFLLYTSPDCTVDKGACMSGDSAIWVEAIEQGKPFVLASANPLPPSEGIVIMADSDPSFTVPMIIKKAYKQFKEEAEKQKPYKELFRFIY